MAPLEALTALVATIRTAGGTLRRDADLLMVRFGRLDAAERDAAADVLRIWKADVLALLDAEAVREVEFIATVQAIFPGATVLTCARCGATRWQPLDADRDRCAECGQPRDTR
jgi:hypothetical protein